MLKEELKLRKLSVAGGAAMLARSTIVYDSLGEAELTPLPVD